MLFNWPLREHLSLSFLKWYREGTDPQVGYSFYMARPDPYTSLIHDNTSTRYFYLFKQSTVYFIIRRLFQLTMAPEYLEYPTNLVRTEAYYHTLESYRAKLNTRGVFHPTYRSVGFIELYENGNGVSLSMAQIVLKTNINEWVAFHKLKSPDAVDQLSSYIDEEDGAPLWRMM